MTLKEKLISVLYSGISLGPASFSTKAYSGDYANIVNNYGLDVAFPFGFYYLNKVFGTFDSSPLLNAVYVMSGCSVLELLQNVGYWPGTFDEKDFLAYATGTILAFGLDKITGRKKNLDKLVEESI